MKKSGFSCNYLNFRFMCSDCKNFKGLRPSERYIDFKTLIFQGKTKDVTSRKKWRTQNLRVFYIKKDCRFLLERKVQ